MPKIQSESVPPIVAGYVEQLLNEFTHPTTRSNSYSMLHNIQTYVTQALDEYRVKEAKGEFNRKGR
jgi:hypothetical protein